MARLDVNRSGEMDVFVRVVELGGFSAAARTFGMTPSAVSKLVSRLEDRLKARLVNRSTRKLQLTPEGCRYYEHGVRVLALMDEAERAAGEGERPAGRVAISANVPFGRHFLLPLVPKFLARFPEISLDISLSDTVIDLLEDRTDIAIRAGPLKSSSLLARRLGATPMMIVGSPGYFSVHGMPSEPEDLTAHNLLAPNYVRAVGGWPFWRDGKSLAIAPVGNVQASDGDALRTLALEGLGLARLAAFQVHADIAEGRLVAVLQAFNADDTEAVHAIFLGQGGHMPARVRALLDFLATEARVG